MRFRRRPRVPFTVTERKYAAAFRSQQRQQDAVPLLSILVREQQPSIEQLMRDRITAWDRSEQEWRDKRAHDWRRARCRLATFEPTVRSALLRYWNEHRWLPGDPSYLLDVLHGFKIGRLILANGIVRPAAITISRHEMTETGSAHRPIASGWLGRRR